MRARLGEMRGAPWTLWAYFGLSAAEAIAGGVVGAGRPWTIPIGLAIEVAFAYFLLRGSRVTWWLLLVLDVGVLPFYLGNDYRWHLPLLAFGLVLLLAPQSRRYVFAPKEPAPEDGSPWDPGAQEDATRARGWYVDPGDETRMRYWDPEIGGWQSKTTKVPKGLRTATRKLPGDGPVTWDASFYEDERRPRGWYLDPGDESRMRYWDPEIGGWQSKTTRAPRRRRRPSRDAG